ncbi:MAG: hypothetical protein LBC68_10895 [Prevotellaceae bacterium]|nr:hypothetical protein [Prevotellaceae bacterium]
MDVKNDIDENLLLATLNTFNLATAEGLQKAKRIPERDFIDALKYNNTVFSAFRVHRMQNDMARQLIDENGKLKSFSQFVKDTENIRSHYVRAWLKTEYDTAVIRAHQAADWRQFEAEKDILPNLEWIPSTSATPGDDHIGFWGTILPVNDAFWNAHKPGDRWNCKCSLRANDKDLNPPKQEVFKNPKNKPMPGLENNPGKDAKLFSSKNAYEQKAYSGAKEAVARLMETIGNNENFMAKKEFKNGGKFSIHTEVDKVQNDYKLINNIGIEFARMGKQVKATPILHFKSDEYKKIYGSLTETKYANKCPDLLVDGKFYEIEGFKPPFKKEKLSNMLKRGLAQSDRLIINNTKGASDRYIKKLIYDRIKKGQAIEEVWLYEKGKIRLLYKKQ